MDPHALVADMVHAASALAEDAPYARERLLRLSHRLIASLETPSETLQRLFWSEPALCAALRIAVDLDIFEQLAEAKSHHDDDDDDDDALASARLAALKGAEPALVARTMKHLAATDVVEERDVDRYGATALSDALALPRYRDGIVYLHDVLLPSFRNLPAYLSSTSHADPVRLADGPFQAAHATRATFFAWLDGHPRYLAAFNHYMGGYRRGRPSWIDGVCCEDDGGGGGGGGGGGFFPVRERLGGARADEVLVVDVGGGLGHDMADLAAAHPDLAGRLVLQDRAEVLAQIGAGDLPARVEAAAHDFFAEQPVRGARAYLLHSVLHDWPDDDCRRILRALRPALVPGRSRLLLHEMVAPDRGAAPALTALDWIVMALFSARQRTEAQLRALLAAERFAVVAVWTYGAGAESLIEAEPV